MRRIGLGLVLGLLLGVAPVAAQSPADASVTPKVEVSVGYAYVRTRIVPAAGCCFNMHGGSVSVAFSRNHWLSYVGDFGGYTAGDVFHSGLTLSVFSYMFGPRFSYRKSSRFTPFVQELVGGSHASGTLYTRGFQLGSAPPSPRNSFSMTAAGGLDVTVKGHFAIRALQAEWYFTNFPNGNTNAQHNLRITAGVVYRLGSR